jgi:hypothetical protein
MGPIFRNFPRNFLVLLEFPDFWTISSHIGLGQAKWHFSAGALRRGFHRSQFLAKNAGRANWASPNGALQLSQLNFANSMTT